MWIEKRLSSLLAATIIVALVFAPLAFGAVEPWAYSVLAVLAYTALALACMRAAVTRSAGGLVTPMLLPAGLALLLVAVQYVKWPAGVLEVVSPRAAGFYGDAAASAGAEEAVGAVSPSLYRHATRDALIRLSAYVALFLATCAYVRSRKHVTRIAAAIVAVGFAVSLLGIVQNLSGTRRLYGWRELTHGGALFGPFVSRNQFASYAGICLFVGLGLLLGEGAHAAGSARRWREGLRRVLTGRAHRSFLMAFASALTGAALIWSLSRGGILSLLLSFAGVFVALRVAGFVRSKLLYVAAVGLVIVGWVTYLGWEPVLKRVSTLDEMARDPLASTRWQMYADASRIGLNFPLLGTGAGTFFSVYPFFRTLPTDAVTRSPHNEYVHVLAEAGLGGVAALLLAMVPLYAGVIRGLLVRNYPFARGFLAGGVGAVLMVTLHSMVDFPMRSPAIAGTMAVTAALLYRATVIESDRKRRSSAPSGNIIRSPVGDPATVEPAEVTGNGQRSEAQEKVSRKRSSGGRSRRDARWAVFPLLVVAVPWAYLCNVALNPLRGQLEGRTIGRASEQLTSDTENVLAFVNTSEENVHRHSPGDAQLYALLADFSRQAAVKIQDPLKRLNLAVRALKLRMAASRLEPLNADHPFEAAMDYLSFRRSDLARLQANRACRLLPNDPWVRAYLAEGFMTFGQIELADHYLEKAERLALARGIDAAGPLLGRVREKLELVVEP